MVEVKNVTNCEIFIGKCRNLIPTAPRTSAGFFCRFV
jgi:hypothetical protein